MSRLGLTADEVRARSELTGRGMQQCRDDILAERRGEWLRTSIAEFRRTGDRDLLADLLTEIAGLN